jgi:hypothetical protein
MRLRNFKRFWITASLAFSALLAGLIFMVAVIYAVWYVRSWTQARRREAPFSLEAAGFPPARRQRR